VNPYQQPHTHPTITTTGASGGDFATHYVWVPEPPAKPPRLGIVIVLAPNERARANPRATMRLVATAYSECDWVAVWDKERAEIWTMTPDEAYLLCAFLAASGAPRGAR